MTTCTNKNRGCRIMKHPDDENCWFCPHCGKKFIEYPGFSLSLVTILGIIVLTGLLLLMSSCESANNISVSSKLINWHEQMKSPEHKSLNKQ
jgi:hypothetical protein